MLARWPTTCALRPIPWCRPRSCGGSSTGRRPSVPLRGITLFGDPVALVVLLVLVLDGAPRHAVGAVLLAVLFFGGAERLLVDLLRVLGQVVLHAVRQLRDHLVRHRPTFPSLAKLCLPRIPYPSLASSQTGLTKRLVRQDARARSSRYSREARRSFICSVSYCSSAPSYASRRSPSSVPSSRARTLASSNLNLRFSGSAIRSRISLRHPKAAPV